MPCDRVASCRSASARRTYSKRARVFWKHFARRWFLFLLALVFALLLLTALSGLLLVLLWDSYRLAGIIGLCVFYGIAALYCGLRLKAAVFDESSPFGATLEELAKDRERLLP